MLRFLLRRLGWSLLVLWFVASATFAIGFVVPGDPVAALLGQHATPALTESSAPATRRPGLRPSIKVGSRRWFPGSGWRVTPRMIRAGL